MDNKYVPLVVVAVVGIVLGVAVASKQAQSPLLRELLTKQSQILQTQGRIEQKLTSQGGQASVASGGELVSIQQKQNFFETRIKALESQVKSLQTQLTQAKGSPTQRQAPPAEDLSKVHDIEVGDSYVLGDKNAKVTVVEFVDFQCPFCARYHPPYIEAVKTYKPKEVNLMIKNFPLSFHPQARPAAKAALAAGEQGKYFEMSDKILENGRNLNEETFERLAKEVGLNVKKFKKDYANNDAKYEEIIKKDMALATRVGVRGTPTFYINGKKSLARDAAGIKREIDGILKGSK